MENEKPIVWAELSRELQDLYLTALWEGGYSEGAIAKFLNVTKGPVVVRRQRILKLPTAGRPLAPSTVDPEHFRELLGIYIEKLKREKHEIVVVPPQAPPPSPPVEFCQWPLASSPLKKQAVCGKEVVPGHKLCVKHLALVPKR